MSKHTPGPWRLAEGRENSKGINDYVWSDAETREEREDASQWCIATVHAREEVSTRAANARLIAAAPDLLEALQWTAGFLGRNFSDADMPELVQIRAAIAKAVQS